MITNNVGRDWITVRKQSKNNLGRNFNETQATAPFAGRNRIVDYVICRTMSPLM